jgi:hypothetical protein
MKVVESRKIVLVSCIIDFKEMKFHTSLIESLKLESQCLQCYDDLLIFSGKILENSGITLSGIANSTPLPPGPSNGRGPAAAAI